MLSSSSLFRSLAISWLCSCTILFAEGDRLLIDSGTSTGSVDAKALDDANALADANASAYDATFGVDASVEQCSIYEQSACLVGTDCYYANAGDVGQCEVSTGDKGQDESCTTQTECLAGYVCRAGCRKVCRPGECSEIILGYVCTQAGDLSVCTPDF